MPQLFKNAFVLVTDVNPTAPALQELAAPKRFAPCFSNEAISTGFIEPDPTRPGEWCIAAPGGLFMAFMIEKKSVPSSAVKREVAKLARQAEEATGRKPGKKALKELKQQAIDALLPRAFPRQTQVNIWFDVDCMRVIIGSSSLPVIDLVTSAVSGALGVSVRYTPAGESSQLSDALTQWVQDQNTSTEELELAGESHLVGEAREKASVAHVDLLASALVSEPILPLRVLRTGLAWITDGVSFMLCHDFSMRKIKHSTKPEKGSDFAAEAALECLPLRRLITTINAAI